MKLERLYKLTKTGATQIIDMVIEGDTYTRYWGQLDGKMQEKATVAKGKNIGKANETTSGQQAIIEAEAVWVKKQKSNYSLSPEAPVTVELPMKVEKYLQFKHKVNFDTDTVFESPKLNGINAEYRLVDGEIKHLSRGGESYPIPPHQGKYIRQAFEQLGVDRINGEQYIHGEHLQDIQAAVTKTNELSSQLMFAIFDLPTLTCSYAEKVDRLRAISVPFFISIEIHEVHSHAELDARHAYYVSKGLEGLMVRNGKGVYTYNTRSYDVLKYKEALDAEFKVVDYAIDKNGHVVFQLDSDGGTFKCKPKGTNESRLEMADNAASYIGKWLKVEYETLSKAGKPLKPVGIMFRKVGADGEATE